MASNIVTPLPANDNDTPPFTDRSAQIVSFAQRKALRDLPTYLKAGSL